MATYPYEFPLNDRLLNLVYHLDRDDLAWRKYWYEKFHSGLT
ncbi:MULTISPECIES: hypothetical protein [unclassified Bartonella]|nr:MULTISPECIES: hypothetical protein [unclassified Bartonella]UXN03328.1 hypothetical protein N6B01_12920 [Bartonella sp. HY406]UXN06284.1 hypothetical protein N6A79_13605 [Bartonella sp. HY761]